MSLDKLEFAIKGVLYVGGPVGAFLSQVPAASLTRPSTIFIALVIGSLSLLGYLSRSYAQLRGASEFVSTEISKVEPLIHSAQFAHYVPGDLTKAVSSSLDALQKEADPNVSINTQS